MATADVAPVTVAQRESWFRDFNAERRPLWVFDDHDEGSLEGWLSVRSFYGRAAYEATAEVGIYVAPEGRRRGIAKALLLHALEHAPGLGVHTLLAFVFSHNAPSIALFARHGGFAQWGCLPRVASLDGVERDLVILGRQVG